jgi:hypothetical protein
MLLSSVVWRRNRIWYAVAIVGVTALGLASRCFPGLFPAFLGKYPGDALWTLMVFLGWGMVLPRESSLRVTLYALATSYLVELSQLYQAPWINSIRGTTVGHLVLGTTFSVADLVAYTVGAVGGGLTETALRALHQHRAATSAG